MLSIDVQNMDTHPRLNANGTVTLFSSTTGLHSHPAVEKDGVVIVTRTSYQGGRGPFVNTLRFRRTGKLSPRGAEYLEEI